MKFSLIRMRVILAVVALVVTFVPVAHAGRKQPLYGTPPEQLFDRIRQEGPIVVIVHVYLDSDWIPEHKLPKERAVKQREEARRKKDELYARNQKMRVLKARDFVLIPAFTAVVDEPALRHLIQDDGVRSIREDGVFRLALDQSIPAIRANVAHGQGFGGDGQVVVVIDSGVDYNHPFLANKLVAEACFTTYNGIYLETCPNVNHDPEGSVPQKITDTGTGSGKPCTSNGTTIPYECRHGTRVAGVAVGHPNSGVGISLTGVAPDADLIAINVGTLENCTAPSGCPSDGYRVQIQESDAIKALEYVYVELRPSHNIAAVNLSFRGGFVHQGDTDCDASCVQVGTVVCDFSNYINALTAANIAVVAAAGNGGVADKPGLPACVANAINVAATNDSDAVASYSSHGGNVDLLAPGGASGTGQGIMSSIPGTSSSAFEELWGTSFSVPHVAGAFAVLKAAAPSKTVAQHLDDLKQTGWPVTDTRSGGTLLTRPRVDVMAALQRPVLTAQTNSTTSTSVNLSWTAVTGATSYEIHRGTSLTGMQFVASTSATSATDSSLTSNTAYIYKIVATGTSIRAVSNNDVATTIQWSSLGKITAQQFLELRQGIDAVCIAASPSGSACSWTEAITVNTTKIKVAHVLEMRNRLEWALGQIGAPLPQYNSTPGSGNRIDDNDILDLRNKVH